MEIVNNVTAQEFIQVVFSNRQEQSNVQLPVEDLDKELFKAKIQQQSKNMSDEEKQLMIQTLQG